MKKEQSMIERLRYSLAEKIRTGVYPPGKKLPGERKLSLEFSASRGTVIEALSLLEKERLIERIPYSGTFVTERILRILLAFPEQSISFDRASAVENWGIVSEVFRGMIAESSHLAAEVILQYFPRPGDERELQRQLQRLEEFDGTVFFGMDQTAELRRGAVGKGLPCMQLAGNATGLHCECPVASGDPVPMFDKICGVIRERRYRRVTLLRTDEPLSPANQVLQDAKCGTLIELARAHRLDTGAERIWRCDRTAKEFPRLHELKPAEDALFVLYTDLVVPLYDYCAARNLRIGRDFGLVGYASGLTFANLRPAMTYGKIDHFAIGRALARGIVEIIRTGHTADAVVPGTFIEGASL